MKPYLKTTTDCGYATYCVASKPLLSLNRTGMGSGSQHRYHLILSDGTTVYFSNFQTTAPSAGDNQTDKYDANVGYAELKVDLNGLKEPNQLGYDVFYFSLTTRQGSPIVIGGSAQWPALHSSYCIMGDPSGQPGTSCGWWVYKRGNMDYLHRNIANAEWVQ